MVCKAATRRAASVSGSDPSQFCARQVALVSHVMDALAWCADQRQGLYASGFDVAGKLCRCA